MSASRTTSLPLSLALCAAAWACRAPEEVSAKASGQPSDLDIPIQQSLVFRGEWPASAPNVARVKPMLYVRPPIGDDGARGVLLVERAKNLIIDLRGVELRGTARDTDLDRNTGVGIVLVGCDDVTIRGGTIGGYKVCIAARDCRGLVLDGVKFDGWYGSHLMSTTLAEDGSDWLYPHENDKDEWEKNYGAAISLVDCAHATVKDCRGRHGQNGVLLTRSNSCEVYDNDFSFLSGWGLALYRSSRNVIAHDRFDYCVRGYSHDVYWRGQDSTGILMFERCSDNLFVANSATHGGDGVFLFAGNDTVEGRAFARGEMDAGGSDRNIWYRNDFSYAVANAIEATFSSDNWAIENILDGSHQHGVWGGYSKRMVVLKNQIHGTIGGGVSIEHGQDCVIADNSIRDDDIGVELWWDEDKGLVDGPFGKNRETSSRDHWILGNKFGGNAQDLVLTATTGVTFGANTFDGDRGKLSTEKLSMHGPVANDRDPRDLLAHDGVRPSGRVVESSVREWAGAESESLKKARAWVAPKVPGSQVTFAADRGVKQGLDTIVMGEWGPWDFESEEPRPVSRLPGGLLAHAQWDALWFSWKDGVDPRKDLEGWRSLQFRPLARASVGSWVNPWGGDASVREKVGSAYFGLIATTHVTIEKAGLHRLIVGSDDGVRVKIDGNAVFEDWTWHAPKRDSIDVMLGAGAHELALEYFQIDGASALTVELEAPRRH